MEIIVVDNYSTDKTKEIVEKFIKLKSHKVKSHGENSDIETLKLYRLYNFQLFNRGPERSAQRNFGVEKSKGDYFLYLDAGKFVL